MVQIIQLQGTDKRLYELVAPLVMNPEMPRKIATGMLRVVWVMV